MASRQSFLDQTNPLNSLLGRADILLVPCSNREYKWIKYNIFRIQTILINKQIMRSNSYFQLVFSRNSLPTFIDRTDYNRSSILVNNGCDQLEFIFTIFKVNGVNYRFTLTVFKRQINYSRIGSINHQRHLNLFDYQLKELHNVFCFIAVWVLYTDIDNLGATFYLRTGNFGCLFILSFNDKPFEFS
ncbi:hypothetical protein D3C72_1097040 [compost metagenome]